jgi:broad specificity phosphatase PhoE
MDFPLSEAGRAQAHAVGKALAGERLDGIYSSPLARAFETAEIISGETNFPGAVVPMAGLSERRGGLLEGTTHAERMSSRNPELMNKFLSLPDEERWTLVGAETDEEIRRRFERAISEIRARHAGGGRVAVVSHGGVMRAFLREHFGAEVLPGTQRAPNASITRIEWDGGGRVLVRELASTQHLAPGYVTGASSLE